MNRREFLQTTGAAALASAVGCSHAPLSGDAPSLTIIDCHTHFYNPTRPEGVPWPGKGESFLYRRILPADYLAEKVPAPVTGTVVVEASSWVEDNQWILDLARNEPFIVGFCGNLDPSKEAFAKDLSRFAANPLYRGIRVSGGNFTNGMRDPGFIRRLGLLADRNLQLDVNVGIDSLPEVTRLARELPSLRIVVDHLANTSIDGKLPNPEWRQAMGAVARHANVFAKVSGLVEGAGQLKKPSPTDTAYYAPWLDAIWNDFGEDRLIYGSNWPVSALFAPLHDVQQIVMEYFESKGADASVKVFAANSRRAYGWVDR
jgi:L-fuconolactonase